MGVRRVITTHDEQGKSVVLFDEIIEQEYHNRVIWTTAGMPASNAGSEDAGAWNQGRTIPNGTVFRMREYQPGEKVAMHRTLTVDYGCVLEGELDMELDGGEVVHFRAGDVLVQRGTNHTWANNGSGICRVIFVNFDAEPIYIDGVPLPDTARPLRR